MAGKDLPPTAAPEVVATCELSLLALGELGSGADEIRLAAAVSLGYATAGAMGSLLGVVIDQIHSAGGVGMGATGQKAQYLLLTSLREMIALDAQRKTRAPSERLRPHVPRAVSLVTLDRAELTIVNLAARQSPQACSLVLALLVAMHHANSLRREAKPRALHRRLKATSLTHCSAHPDQMLHARVQLPARAVAAIAALAARRLGVPPLEGVALLVVLLKVRPEGRRGVRVVQCVVRLMLRVVRPRPLRPRRGPSLTHADPRGNGKSIQHLRPQRQPRSGHRCCRRCSVRS